MKMYSTKASGELKPTGVVKSGLGTDEIFVFLINNAVYQYTLLIFSEAKVFNEPYFNIFIKDGRTDGKRTYIL